MNKDYTILLLAAAVELETEVAALYHHFAESYPEDLDFWSQLKLEEKRHAALLRAALDSYSKRDQLPGGILAESLEMMVSANRTVTGILNDCKKTRPSRCEAFRIALRIEDEIGEKHYNTFMSRFPQSGFEKVFQRLNQNDKDHARRIAEYMNTIAC